MEVADVLITKPGGLTASEALAKKLPMLLISVIPGQEEENARFLVKKGAAIRVRDVRVLSRYLERLFIKGPLALQNMGEAAASLRKPHAACQIAQTIFDSIKHVATMRSAR